MKFLLVLIFLFHSPGDCLGLGMHGWEYYEAKYEDLLELNASCYPKDSCREKSSQDYPEIPYDGSCSCYRHCSKFGTCCIDSPYRHDSLPSHKCIQTDVTHETFGYYMVDKCSRIGGVNTMWEDLCEEEWRGENDVIKLTPVTSIRTSTTYKNYYCFRCHENTDEFLYWNTLLQGDYNDTYVRQEAMSIRLQYSQAQQTWVATIVEKGISIPIKLKFLSPEKLVSLPVMCHTDIISQCSESYADKYLRDKCNEYTAIVYMERNYRTLKYKNPHCALCNFESLDSMRCESHIFSSRPYHFSFAHLVDINRSRGDKVGKSRECEENFLWDPYRKKCRKISCALSGYVIKEGKCTPP